MNISVAIPTFKRPDALRRNLQSIINSQVPCFEVVIGDDGGDLETADIIKAFSKLLPIKHILPDGRGSLATNVARIIKAVQGEWTLFIHDDDFLIGNHSQYLKKNAHKYDFLFSDHWISDDNGVVDTAKSDRNSETYHRTELKDGIQQDGYKLAIDHVVCLDGFYIRTAILKNFTPQVRFGQVADYYWMFKILTSDIKIGYCKERTFAYVLSEGGLTNQGGHLNEDSILVYRALMEEDENEERKKIYRKRISQNTWYAVNACLRRGEKQKAQALLKTIHFNYTHSLKHKLLLPIQLAWIIMIR